MDVLTKDLIKLSEEKAVRNGAFSFRQLMKIAGERATEIILRENNIHNKKIAVVCGTGNNGGDGFVIAKNLNDMGADVTVIIPLGEPTTEDANYYYLQLCDIKTTEKFESKFDIIIDAIFGIGLNRDLSIHIKEIIEKINEQSAVRISVDIPSGIECDSGRIFGNCVNADMTVTFIAPKPCFMLPPATNFTGKVVVADIGVKPVDFLYKTIEKPDFPPRMKNSHKGTFGTAVLFCGSYGMAGAAILSLKSCLRSGVGIAKCVIPKRIYPIITSAVPEAVCIIARQTKKGTFKANTDIVTPLEKARACLIGCGIGNNKNTVALVKKLLLYAKIPLVIDADGINALVPNIDILKKTNATVILTPHPAEMARLVNLSVSEVEKNRIKTATDFSTKYKCHVVLKGSNTIVATPNGEIFFNICGNSGMATGGSGDVLAGIIVSYLAQGFDVTAAINGAVYVHSSTADKVAEKRGETSLLPSDIIEAL